MDRVAVARHRRRRCRCRGYAGTVETRLTKLHVSHGVRPAGATSEINRSQKGGEGALISVRAKPPYVGAYQLLICFTRE